MGAERSAEQIGHIAATSPCSRAIDRVLSGSVLRGSSAAEGRSSDGVGPATPTKDCADAEEDNFVYDDEEDEFEGDATDSDAEAEKQRKEEAEKERKDTEEAEK